MKKAIAVAVLTAAVGCCPPIAEAWTDISIITIENPVNRNREDVPVVLDLAELAPGKTVTAAYVKQGLVRDGSGLYIPAQLDDLDGDGVADELAFTVSSPAKSTQRLTLELTDEEVQREFSPRVYASLMLHGRKKGESVEIREVDVPGSVNFYNMCFGHGPMFESELVGYRVYFNEKQTLDPYGKFNKGLELEESRFYPDDDMLARGFGDDVLLAGNSCGIGAFKGWDGEKATHIAPVDSRAMRVLASGPVRTIVECEVRGWDYQGDRLDMVNRYTLYAGHRDVQIDVEFAQPLSGQAFATGVERIMGNETVSWSDHCGTVASWGRHWPVNDTVKYAKETIGIATCIPRRYVDSEQEDASNFLYVVKAPGERGFRYHTMFTSTKETFGFPDSESWFAYMPVWRDELENPVKVTVSPFATL